MVDERGWYSRGYLPHIDIDGAAQFLTWRAADALPVEVLEAWKTECNSLPENERKVEIARRIEAYCDQGHGECLLRDPRAARAVQETLFHDHPDFYELHAWVIMPNHVHVLLTPKPGIKLAKILHRIKPVSAKAVNRVFGKTGQYWQPEYFDRYMRDQDHFDGVKRYIEWNPVKAKLCTDPAKWAWSSCCVDARARLDFLISQREK